MTFKPLNSPPCFGDPKLWSPSAVECVGGLDLGYTNPLTHSHKRDKCSWYGQCATAASNARIGAQTTSIGMQPVTVAPPPSPAQSHPMIQTYGRGPGYYPTQGYPVQPLIPQVAPQQMVPPWMAQFGPQLVPMAFQQPGTQIGAYLTVPEPVSPGEGWFFRLVREIFRSMLKSSGHTAASFFDHNPWKSYAPPPTPPPAALPTPPPQPTVQTK